MIGSQRQWSMRTPEVTAIIRNTLEETLAAAFVSGSCKHCGTTDPDQHDPSSRCHDLHQELVELTNPGGSL